MKKLNALIILAVFIFASCGKETKERKSIPQSEVGKAVFSLMKDMDTISSKEFTKRVMTYEEMQSLVNDKSFPLGDYMRNEMKITPDFHKTVSEAEYTDIKNSGVKYTIDWNKITFVSFKHDFQEIDEGRILLGETYFKNTDGKIYFVKSAAFFDGKGYIIAKIAEIEPEQRGSFNKKQF
jgi:hypothetical protein